MTKTRGGVLPRTKTSVRMPPGSPTPRSSILGQVGPRGDTLGEQIESSQEKALPPDRNLRQGWIRVSSPDDEP